MTPLATPEELNAYTRRTVDPVLADLLLAGATGTVQTYCGWGINAEAAVTFTVDGSGSQVLSLPTLELTDVQSVTVNGVALDPATDYKWSRRGQLYRCAGVWSTWSQIDAVVDHGYVTAPDVLKIVALALASRFIDNPQALKSAQVGSVSRTWSDSMLTSLEMALLDAYRLP